MCASALAVTVAACGSSDDTLRTPDGSVITTTETRFAQVNIVSAGRDYSRTCLAPTPPDPGRPDSRRIVVTDPVLLDALCALGLGPQVRAVVSGERGHVPGYLGPQLGSVPVLRDTPTADDVRTAAPDLVLSTPATADRVAALEGTRALGAARKASVVDGGTDWRATFTAVAAATNRSAAGRERLAEFDAEAKRVGLVLDAAHSQVSLVRFRPDQTLLEGMSPFGARIMDLIGVGRPPAQRVPDAITLTEQNLRAADADLIYVSYDGEAGRARAESVLLSDAWLDMGAPSWKRVLSVDDAVWHTASGLAGAWLVLNDVKDSLNGGSGG